MSEVVDQHFFKYLCATSIRSLNFKYYYNSSKFDFYTSKYSKIYSALG